MVRKNSIRLSSDRDVGTYLFGLRDLENPGSQLGWQKIPLSLTEMSAALVPHPVMGALVHGLARSTQRHDRLSS